MEWHYVSGGQQLGPVSSSEFENLRRTGVITRETLVWREGWKTWHPFGKVAETASRPAPVLATADAAPCAECGQVFAKGEMVSFEQNFVCAACKPVFFQKMLEGIAPGASGTVWRSGRQLVTLVSATLPDRCVKCNAPAAGGRLKRKLSWHHPALYLTILIGLLIYVIVAATASKRATVIASLCALHRSRRKRDILISWALAVSGIVGVIAAITNESGGLGLAGGVAIFAGLIYAIATTRVLAAKKIDREHAWMTGCCPEFLADFPEWLGPN